MTARPETCRRVFERLVEDLDAAAQPEVAEHLRTCLDCFRALSELRDAPRIAALLRRDGDAPDDADDLVPGFWDRLAARNVAAAARLLPPGAAPRAPVGSRRRWVVAGGLTAAAAAALIWTLGAPRPAAVTAPAPGLAQVREPVGELAGGELADDEMPGDVADLDSQGVADDIAALDEPALRRLARELAGSAL
jgi:hypothetical protein